MFLSLTKCNLNKKGLVLDDFNTLIAGSNRVIIRFTSNDLKNSNPLVRVIYKAQVMDELNELIKQSGQESNCNNIDGTMAFFKDSTNKGSLEFSINPDCIAFYLHYSGRVTQYKMSPFCAMFLESIRQGEK